MNKLPEDADYIVDYQIEEDGEPIRETHPSRSKAESRARRLSKKHADQHLLVYVYLLDNPSVQTSFYAGRIEERWEE